MTTATATGKDKGNRKATATATGKDDRKATVTGKDNRKATVTGKDNRKATVTGKDNRKATATGKDNRKATNKNIMKTKNKIPNAQLAAWIGCVPSTIHIWRKGYNKITTKTLRQIEKITQIPIDVLRKNLKTSTMINLIETKYCEMAMPMANISGRDFTDQNRLNSEAITKRRKEISTTRKENI